jgi:hypothetical protein
MYRNLTVKQMIGDAMLKPGDRFRLTILGIERCPKLAAYTGTVIGINRTRSGFYVLLDGTKSRRIIHQTYIMPIHQQVQGAVTETRIGNDHENSMRP